MLYEQNITTHIYIPITDIKNKDGTTYVNISNIESAFEPDRGGCVLRLSSGSEITTEESFCDIIKKANEKRS